MRVVGMWMLLGVGLVGLVGCGPGKPDVPVDGWAVARAALVDGESCYAQRPEYCIDEPAILDAAIQAALDGAALDGRWNGTMPPNSKEVEKVVRSARGHYEEASQTPESLDAIEARVEAYYAEPKVDASDPELVNVDLGAVPGELGDSRRPPHIVLSSSPLIDTFWWQSAEAGRVLARYAAAHPDKNVVRVQVLLPTASGYDHPLVYRYFHDEQRVVYGKLGETSVYMSPPVELEAMAAGRLKLGTKTDEFCSKPKAGSSSGKWCPWQDPYGEAAKKAAREAKRKAR